ncbi:hypothetical protein B0H14DRAFT_2589431 [Mycena olivaceomarginata]|nr:hypothetical protein B0H14DRAFT_2589431 [Mycena olivaceomarginata]
MPRQVVLSDDKDSGADRSLGTDEGNAEEYLQPIDVDASKGDIIKRVSELEATATSKRRRRDRGDNRLGYEKHVGQWARHFFLTKETWVTPENFRASPPDLSLDPATRFSSNTACSRSVTATLFEVVPPKYHSLIDYSEYKHMAKDFITELGNARSSLINSLRGVIASILTSAGYNVNSTILGVATADRSQDKVLLGLLRFPDDKTSKIFAPILFPNGEKRMDYIFLSKMVLDLHRAMVHGPSSLAANSKPDPKANGTKYGLVEATDHSIALAAIFARFLISADKIFASTGAITNITWEEDYRTYRKLLASNRNTPLVKHKFKTVNTHVFAGVSKTAGTAEKEVEDVEDEISDAMHRLAFGNFDDPPQSDDDAAIPSDHSNGPARPLAVKTRQPAAGPSRHA